MPRPCSICSHPQSAEITKALTSGGSLRAVAERFKANHASAGRHLRNCLKTRRSAEQGKSDAGKRDRDSSIPSGADSSRFVTEAVDRCPSCGVLSNDPDPRGLIRRAERLLWLAESIAAKAQKDDDARLALQAADRARPMLEQLLKVHGLLQPDGATIVDQRQVHLTALIAGKTDEELEAMLAAMVADGRRALQ